MVVENIKEWLKSNRHKANIYIDKTECHKWKHWRRGSELPIIGCAGSEERNEECIFIEIFYGVWKYYKSVKNESVYIDALLEYEQMEVNEDSVFTWRNKYEQQIDDIDFYDCKFQVILNKDRNEILEVVLPEEELKHILKFKEIYYEY